MSARIVKFPPTIALSHELMQVTVATNLVTAARARVDITLSASGPAADQVWTLGWLGKYIQFTFKSQPNSSGIQLPIADPSVGVTVAYVHQLAESLMRHEWVSEQFTVETRFTMGFKIALISRFDQSLTIVSVSPISNFAVVVSNVASPYLQPNLTALVKVISRKGREIAKLSGNYQVVQAADKQSYEGQATFDIGALFDLAPHLPDVPSFTPSVSFTHGIAFRAYCQYFLRYADKFGTTPVAESLRRTSPLFAILGGRSVASTLPFVANTKGIYRCHLPKTQIVTRHQATWFYFFATKQYNRTVINVRLKFADGTIIDVWSGVVHQIRANKLYYYRTGFEQLNIPQTAAFFNLDPNAIVSYEWQLIDELSRDVYITQRYDLEDCRHDSLYLACSNGFGGIDSLHVKGGYTLKSEVDRTLIRRTDTAANANPSIGAIVATDATIQQVWEIQTGLVTPQYADELRQLLLGDVWLIDNKNKRFLKLVADTKSMETRPKNGNMVALNLVFKSAWIDKNAL
jgi:hypothetical protein